MSIARGALRLLIGRDLLRFAEVALAMAVLGFAAAVFAVVLILKSLFGFANSSHAFGLLPGTGGSPGPLAAAIPGDQLAFMQQVAAASACGMPWTVLAGVAYIESDFGQNLGPSPAGAYGYGQFMPGT